MTPLSVKRSLMEVHLQHQILMKDLHRKVYSPYETDKRVLQADFSGSSVTKGIQWKYCIQ